jgi:hypothetical protein
MNDSGLWKRGIALLVAVGVITGIALYVALWRPGSAPVTESDQPVCPELLTYTAYFPAAATVAPFPAALNWGVMQEMVRSAPSAPGWQVRYMATLTLARKGEVDLPYGTLVEMLDEQQQIHNAAVCTRNGRIDFDETAARQRVYNALQVIAQWHKHPARPTKFAAGNADLHKKYEAGLAQVVQSVEQLTQNPNNVLRTEAQKTLQVLRET